MTNPKLSEFDRHISRRDFLKIAGAGAASLVLPGCLAAPTPELAPIPTQAATKTAAAPATATNTPKPTDAAIATATSTRTPTQIAAPESTKTPTKVPTKTLAPTPTNVPQEIPEPKDFDTLDGPAGLHGKANMDYANNLLSKRPSNIGVLPFKILNFANGRSSYDLFVAGKATKDGSFVTPDRPILFFDVTASYLQANNSYIEFLVKNVNNIDVPMKMKLGGNPIITNIGGRWGVTPYETNSIYQPGNIESEDKVGYLDPQKIYDAVYGFTSTPDKPVEADGTGTTEIFIFSGK